MAVPQPIPQPNPNGGVPNVGSRPPGSTTPANPTPAPSPGNPPGTSTGYPKPGDPAPNDPGIIDKIGDALTPDWASNASDTLTAARDWITDRHNWTRVAWFGAGVACFVVGLVMVGQRPLSAGIGTVAGPVGKVATAVISKGK